MSNVAPTAALIIAMAALCAGQTPSWTAPRRPDGQPDLQGIWNTTTITPLERPKEFAQKQILTADEAAALRVNEGDKVRVLASQPHAQSRPALRNQK